MAQHRHERQHAAPPARQRHEHRPLEPAREPRRRRRAPRRWPRARGRIIDSQNDGDGSGTSHTAATSRTACAELCRCRRGTARTSDRCAARSAASVPSRRRRPVRRGAGGVMARSRGSSSGWPARGRNWLSPRRPRCRGCRRSRDATARGRSAGSASPAALAAAPRSRAGPRARSRGSRRVAGPRLASIDERSASSGSVSGVLGADAVQADVDRDPVQPGRKRRLALETRQALPGAHERFLDEVAGVLVVVHEAVAHLVDATAVPLDEHVEGGSDRRLDRRRRAPVVALRLDHSDRPFRRRRQHRSAQGRQSSCLHRTPSPCLVRPRGRAKG